MTPLRPPSSVEKVALVTGGAQGIGRGIALALAGQGWQVAVADLVAYLLSDAAGFITAQNFVVDGGMTKKMIYV